MNALFLTQSSSLDMFHALMRALRAPLDLGNVGFYVSDRRHFETFREREPDIASGSCQVVKEWEILQAAPLRADDRSLLQRFERELEVPSLWPAVVADRRLYNGPLSTLRQDYRPRFSQAELHRILAEGLVQIERLFDEVQPDIVVSFICVTFGEYLAYLFARRRGIRFLNLRPTRIRNYVTYGETIYEPAAAIRDRYEIFRREGCDPRWAGEARAHIDAVRGMEARYEGVVAPSRGVVGGALSLDGLAAKVARAVRTEYRDFSQGLRADNHSPGWLTSRIYRRVLNPMRAASVHRALAGHYVGEAGLADRDYVFFPLHTEPEVSLLVYSRPFLNQIEVIRTLSHSLPAGCEVLVKEHPASVGKRPVSYYRKLLAIPNVRLADPALSSRPLIEHSRMVATIAGSIGLEALLYRKPVLTFGLTPYAYLPSSMTARAERLDALPDTIHSLLHGHQSHEDALVAFVAATMCESAPVNLYSTLLRKAGVYRPAGSDGGDEWTNNVDALAAYTARHLASRAGLGSTATALAASGGRW